jgi:hypothetical protein
VNLSGAALNHAIQMDLSSSEFLQRIQVIQKTNENDVFFHQLSNTLIAKGIRNKPLSKAEERNFVLGAAPNQFYNVWEEANVRSGIVQAGGKIGKPAQGGDLTVGEGLIHQLMGTVGRDALLSNSGAVTALYSKFTKDLQSLLPETRYQGYGVTKKDILTGDIGGKGSLTIQKELEQIQANAAARGQTEGLQQVPQQAPGGYTTGTQ